MTSKVETDASRPRGFWENAEDILNSIWSDQKINWSFRNFKRVLQADNPFLKIAPDKFLKEAFDFIEFGSSPLRSSLTYAGEVVKFTGAIREIKPDLFSEYHIVRLETMGLPVLEHYRPDLEGSRDELKVLKAIVEGMSGSTQNKMPEEFPYLDHFRQDKNFQSELSFLTEIATDQAKVNAVLRFMEARERLAGTHYQIDVSDFQTPWQDYDGHGFDFDQAAFDNAIELQGRFQEDASKELDLAKLGLDNVGIKSELVDGLKLNSFQVEGAIHEIHREEWIRKQQGVSDELQTQVEKVAEKFHLDLNKGNDNPMQGEVINSKGISL